MQSKSLLLLCLGLLAGSVAGANLRAGNKVQAHLTAMEKDADAISNSLTLPAAMQRVVTMLENLISEMDAEEKQDDKMFEEFNAWFATQSAATQQSIDTLNAKIEEFKAILAQLRAQKAELEEEIRYLNGEIQTTQTQIDQATEKRNEEHDAFVGEQQDFQNSINACNKAVEILAKHYGDGTTPQAEKPAWMGLIQLEANLRSSSNVRGGSNGLRMLSTLVASHKGKGPFDTYQDSSGEALGIVDQVKVLAQTFAEDKQSAIDEENRLQKVYETLMAEKTESLRTLVEQRDRQQGVLNQVNQDIGENETGLANAETELANEQAYLAQITQQHKDTTDLYHMRKHDRAEERAATDEAIKILSKGSPDSMSTMAFVQLRATTKTGCPQCERATILLRKAARSFHSELLAVAAAAAMGGAGGEALNNVIIKLEDLIKRLDEEQAMEDEHKAWCENEMSTTQQKKAEHEANVAKLTQEIADTTEVIKEKIQAIADTEEAIKEADKAYQEATQLRAEQKAAYEVELQNYKDAISALNEAIDILAKFYGGREFVQTGVDEDAAPRADAPGTFSGAYEKKGGGVVKMLSETRHEFEVGKANLIQAETEAQADYDAAEKDYRARRASLVEAKNTFTVELQTAQNKLEQAKEDKQANEEEIASAVAYLAQLDKSCKSLLENYQDRVNMRNEEKKAINEAIGVLKEVA